MLIKVNTKAEFYGVYGNKLSFDVNDELESIYDDFNGLENALIVALQKIVDEWEDAYLGIDVVSKQYYRVYDDNGNWVKDVYSKNPTTFELKSTGDWLVRSMNCICGG